MQGMLNAAGVQGETAKEEKAEEESEEEMLQRAIALSLECHNQPDLPQTEEMPNQKLRDVIWYKEN